MSRSKTLRKTHKARKVARIGSLRIPPWWLDEYFGPLERFVEQIHMEGVVDASATGVLVHLLPDGRLYYPVAEMWRMAEVFRIAQLRDASCPGSGLLMRVAGTLHTGQLLTPDDVDDLRRCVRALRAYAGSQSRSSMIDLIQTARIKIEIGKANHSRPESIGSLTYGET